MFCARRSSVCKVFASSALALLLLGAPLQLAAIERETQREAPAAAQASTLGWFAGLWSGLTAWFTEAVVAEPPQSEPPPQSTTDNGCAVDPHGGCGG